MQLLPVNVVIVPVWLSLYLRSKGLSLALAAGGPDALCSILGTPDVKSYELANRLARLKTLAVNPLLPIISSVQLVADPSFTTASQEGVFLNRNDVLENYPEQNAITQKLSEQELFTSLMGLGLGAPLPETPQLQRHLDFEFEVIGNTLVVEARCCPPDLNFDNGRPGSRAVIYLKALKALDMMAPRIGGENSRKTSAVFGTPLFEAYLNALNQESTASQRQVV